MAPTKRKSGGISWIAATLVIVLWISITCGGMSFGYWILGVVVTIVLSSAFANALLKDRALSWLLATFGYFCVGLIFFSLFGETVGTIVQRAHWDRNALFLPFVSVMIIPVIWKSAARFRQLLEESEDERSK